ncbi:diguanylate cyclase [Actinoplanes sp. SE50]|uniref:diguanylate cyclase n=1 Tax=unclassified Actinoplanes TaxID=2626549 RepID=UPI00023EDE0E|nr:MULTISPECIES: diguanylate cyclase [unclassified Actinoplanes]AEV88692.1 Methyl-accepting chemotaxis protein tlpC [Actinoplanes sp. SE50/110]ATO87096.1 diguanylate cyclase [Actinoplanes sp. SE50]SLM04514.1 diguanylate cyclase [Actinoplanes sp. SE50/110]
MTLRGRLTSAFLVVVLGPVLLGSIFVALTVSAVGRERTNERLDHAVTTVRAAVGAICGQLQAAADAVAVVPAESRSTVADQLIDRGLAGDIRVDDTRPAASGTGDPTGVEGPGGPSATARGAGGPIGLARRSGVAAAPEAAAPPVVIAQDGAGLANPVGWQDCAAPRGGTITALAASARAGEITVVAAQRVDAELLRRLGESAGVTVALKLPETDSRQSDGELPASGDPQAGPTNGSGDPQAGLPAGGSPGAAAGRTGDSGQPGAGTTGTVGEAASRRVEPAAGQPLPLLLSAPVGRSGFRYAVLPLIVLVTAVLAVIAARWLARSTTRPLGELAWAADRVANGDLDTRVPIPRPDELGRLAGTFNRMTRELQSYVQALTASRDQLRRHLAILGDTLSSTHDLDRILPVILRTAMTTTGARAGLVLLVDPADGSLTARCGAGLTGDWDLPPAELVKRRLAPARGVLGVVAASGVALRGASGGPSRAADAADAPSGGASHVAGGVVPDGPVAVVAEEPVCESYLAVPICAPPVGDMLLDEAEAGPGTLGVLALYDRLGSSSFDDADLRTLRTFAGQAGVAVRNVRVHEEAQRLSLTDPLTGLWNYRYLREVLRREVERASRFGRMLTVLALDLDHFKEVNDTYGHPAGDQVLGEFARRIRMGLREVDVAFRQGGEEFVVLLPETDAYGGVIVAERLGALVRDRPVVVDPRRPGQADRIPISVSIGIAVFPEHADTAQGVLDAADEALYAAKNAGRDTYRLAESVSSRTVEGNFAPAPAGSGPQPPRHGSGR